MNSNRKTKRVKVVSLAILILIFLTGYVVSYVFVKYQKKSADFNNPQTDNIIADTSQTLVETPSNGSPPSDEKVLIPTIPSSSAPGATAEVPKITRAEQTQNDSVRVSAVYTQPSNGTCKLVLSKGSINIEKYAPIVIGPSYYTCNGFLIARSEIPENGEWAVKVIHQLNGLESSSSVANIHIE